jgi:hypothetical protein
MKTRARLPTAPLLFLAAVTAAVALSGCGKLFDNSGDIAPTTLGQLDSAGNAGVAAATTETITPDGKNLTILNVSSIQTAQTSTVHTAANDIILNLSLRSESADFSSVHLKELGHLTAANGVYSTDSALGCHYTLDKQGTAAAHIAALAGSCITAVIVELPDHDIPRTYLGVTPLFSGEIEISDVLAVFAAVPHDANLIALLQTYTARLAPSEKPVLMSDVATLILGLPTDAKRIEAIATLAARVSDPANAAGTLPKAAFTSATNYTRAVAIFSAYP